MIKLLRHLYLACTACFMVTAVFCQPAPATIALVGARIYPSPGAPVIEHGTVLIRNGKIVAVGSIAQVPVGKEVQVIDCKGKTLTAAFWNCHIHLIEPKWANADSLPAAQLTRQLQEMLTGYGFAHVFELATFHLENTLALRKRISTGEVTGPRIYTVGVPFTPPNGSPFYIEPLKLPELGTPQQATAYVQHEIAAGADGIKLWSESPAHKTVVPMPLDVVKAAVAAAHARHKPVFAHPTNLEGASIAIAGGVDVLAHVAPDDHKPWTAQTVHQMLARHMALIPTLKLYEYENRKAGVLDTTNDPLMQTAGQQAYAYEHAGGQILFGTDVGYMADYSTLEEYRLLAKAGFTYQQILTALTTAPALRFGVAAHTGKIAAGMDADVVLLNSDPADNVAAFADVAYTFYQGKIIYKKAE